MTMSAKEQQQESNENNSSASTTLESKLREMREQKLINFTDKKDYPEKLKLLAKSQDVDYTTAYKAMKKVAKESGDMVGKPETKKKESTQGGMKFEFNAKPTPKSQIEIQKKQHELKQKQAEMETQLKTQEMILSSPVYGMASEQNKLNLLMIREFIKGVGGTVGTEAQYDMLSKQLTLKELEHGWQPSGTMANLMLGASIFGVFVLPMIPTVRKWLGKDDDDEDNKKKSDEPLDEIPEEEPQKEKEVKN